MEPLTATQTISETTTPIVTPRLVLRLQEKKNKITWTDDTIDNEKLNKKSSKRKPLGTY